MNNMQKRWGLFSEYDLVSGVYKITNKATGNFYIGSTYDMRNRFKSHRRDMKKGTLINKRWAAEVRQYGVDAFVFEALERTPSGDRATLIAAERKWFHQLKPTLNQVRPS
jgi:group I intron endonuclease